MARRVVTDPRIPSGKPVVAGTRIPVFLIRNLLDQGDDIAPVLRAYPTLTAEAVGAGSRYSDRPTPSAVDRDRIR